MKVHVFGPVSVSITGTRVDLGGPLNQLAVAILAANIPHPVPAETLIDRLWPVDLPETDLPKNPRSRLYEIMKAIRHSIEKAGGDRAVVPASRGSYSIQVEAGDVDLHRFHRLRSEARERGLHAHDAVRRYRSAFAQWEVDSGSHRPEPYAGLTGPWVHGQRRHLEMLYRTDLLACLDLELLLGLHRQSVPQLTKLHASDPSDEAIARMLMLAHYRSGQQNEALLVYQGSRTALKQHGNAPSSDLQALQKRILDQNPDLDVAAATTHTLRGERSVAENQFTNNANDNSHVWMQVSQMNGDLHTDAPKPTDTVRRQLKELRREVRAARRDQRLDTATADRAIAQLDEAGEFLDQGDGRDLDGFVSALEAFQRLVDGANDLTQSAGRLATAARIGT